MKVPKTAAAVLADHVVLECIEPGVSEPVPADADVPDGDGGVPSGGTGACRSRP